MNTNFTLEDSLQLLANNYHKILRINLTEDSHTELKMYAEERSTQKGYSEKISEWLKQFALTGQVDSRDCDMYLKFTDINNIKSHFEQSDERMRFRYRRNTNGEFKWVVMEIMKSSEYQKDNQIVILYIQDVHDAYVKELEHNKELEFYCNYDTMTGLANFYSYRSFCNSFAASLCEKTVGVMFGDLNRLKYVNDTEGHEAGNHYIRTFADKLKKFFWDWNCYRVSGDEFIVIYSGEDEDSFYQRAKAFEELIKSDNVPTASIGYAYGITNELETVTTIAEQMMYADKQEFYENFPQFKRAIAEENFKKEMDELVKVLTDSYEALLLIDLELDEYRIMKKSETSIAENETERGVYSLRNMYFSRTYVASEYQKLREEVGQVENLKKRLLEEDHISCAYQLINGEWREAVFWRMEVSAGEVSKVIYYSQDLDASMAKRMEQRQEMSDEFRMIAGLREEYSMIGIIDLETENVHMKDVFSQELRVFKEVEDISYKAGTELIAENVIVPEEREDFIRNLQLDKIVEALKEKELLSYFNHVLRDDGSMACYRFNFCYEQNNQSKIVLAIKDITDIVEWAHGK
ncbi:MAG: GGDEF domain-containing protein [Lachnospiraceae bacterium]|nr:GGDEF domain-containing protein [Candidatus Merdinaster equi]